MLRALARSALMLLPGCIPCEGPASPPPRYAALPARAAAPTFVPAAELTPATLTCRPAELVDNGIDDDCDGHIDLANLPRADLIFAASHAGAEPLALEITADATQTRAASATQAKSQSPSPGVSVERLELRELPSGRYTVSLRAPGAAGGAALPVALAVEGRAGVQLYLTGVTAGAVVVLGRVEVP